MAAERDEAVIASVMQREDMAAMRAQMEDAAVYIASLKRKMAQMEAVASHALHQRDAAAAEAEFFERGAEAAFAYAASAGDKAQPPAEKEEETCAFTLSRSPLPLLG